MRPPVSLAGVATFLASTLLAGTLAVPAAAAETRPLATGSQPSNPPANLAPPALLTNTGTCTQDASGNWTCPSPCAPHRIFGYNDSPGCLALALSAVNDARRAEHLPSIVLPTNFIHLSIAQQMFVLVNLERIARHVPPLVGLSPSLDAAATQAALLGADVPYQPSYGPVQVTAFSSVWAGISPNATAALFGWMYDDGWGGAGHTSNLTCTSQAAKGCWGHRDSLLGEGTGTTCMTCVAGGGYAATSTTHVSPSYAFMIVTPTESTPVGFSWNKNVLPYLNTPYERVTATS